METKIPRIRTQVLRLYKLEELLLTRSAGMTAAQMAAELHTYPRTIYRDLLTLSEIGVPLYQEENHGPFKILGTYTRPSYRHQILNQQSEISNE